MVNTNRLAEIGSLVGEPARAAMLLALMDGRALTATELARSAGITPQTASTHLARLTSADLLRMARQGRHRYHRLASPDIARLLEDIMQIASLTARPERRIATGPRDAVMRRARTCYDHFAGQLGVAITGALVTRRVIEFDDEAGLISADGIAFLARFGIGIAPGSQTSTRPLCRPCLDWSERRPHVAGKVGAAICTHFLEKKFVRRIGDTRALEITPPGIKALREMFGIRNL
ncbi:ArsR/SmtB family transcription factor [Parvibaculum sp.]|uniref:ArsR/SmtB family transcription factor n=1 Tax=Parvibaculum sp. TaxID=2024848 RepID=UPI00349FEE3B